MEASDKKAFEEYFNLYYEQVKKYVLKRIGDEFVAEDLAMETFTACYKNFEKFDSQKASFATWLYVILNNKLKNYYRDHKLFEELNETSTIYDNLEDDILQAQYISMLRDDLATAMLDLTMVQREIIKKKFFENKKSEEIALALGLTPVNVRVHLSRALAKLRKYFEENGMDWG